MLEACEESCLCGATSADNGFFGFEGVMGLVV